MPQLDVLVAQRVDGRARIAANRQQVEQLLQTVGGVVGAPGQECHPAIAGGDPFAELQALPGAVQAAMGARSQLSTELSAVEAEIERAKRLKRNLVLAGIAAGVVVVLLLLIIISGGGG